MALLQIRTKTKNFKWKTALILTAFPRYSWSPLSSLSVGQIGFLLKLNSDSPTNHSTAPQVLSLPLNYLELNNIFHSKLQEFFYVDQDDLEKRRSLPRDL